MITGNDVSAKLKKAAGMGGLMAWGKEMLSVWWKTGKRTVRGMRA